MNTTSNLYDLEYRNFDPVLGRMHQVDPMADKYSGMTPYNFAFNSPTRFNDPNGADAAPGEPDYVKRRNLGDFYSNHQGMAFGYTSISSWDFLSQGLHDVISQSNPDFYGPSNYYDEQTGLNFQYMPSDGVPMDLIEFGRAAQDAVNNPGQKYERSASGDWGHYLIDEIIEGTSMMPNYITGNANTGNVYKELFNLKTGWRSSVRIQDAIYPGSPEHYGWFFLDGFINPSAYSNQIGRAHV